MNLLSPFMNALASMNELAGMAE